MKAEHRTIGLSIALAILLWVADAVVETIFFADNAFLSVLITEAPPHELFMRTTNALLVFLCGLAVAFFMARRRRVEEQLRKSEELYRGFAEGTQDLVWKIDAAEMYTYLNPAWERLLGYRPDEMLGKRFTEFQRPEVAARDIHEYQNYRSRSRSGYETAMLSKAGEDVNLILSIVPILDRNRRNIGFQGTGIDITERKRAEVARERSEASLAEAQRIGHLGSWEWDIVRDEIRWSDELCRIFGLDPDNFDASYDGLLDRVHPDDRDRVKERVETTFLGNDPYDVEFRIVLPDGSVRIIHSEGRLTRDAEGTPIRLVGTAQDITERKRHEVEHEQSLRDSGKRVKELQCMYGVFRSIRSRDTLAEVFRDVSALITTGWQYPEITRVRVFFENEYHLCQEFEETEWKQSSDLVADGTVCGRVEVYYLERRPEQDEGPFQREEQRLLDGIAHALSEAIAYKHAEERLRRSERGYRGLFEDANDAIFVFDMDSEEILETNRRVSEIYGYDHDELVGNTLDLIQPENRRGRRSTQEILASVHPFEVIHTRKDGTELVIEIKSRIVDYRGRQAVMSVNRDVTDRKRLEQTQRVLRDLGLELSGISSLDEGLKRCVEAAVAVSGLDCGMVYLRDDASGAFRLVVHQGLSTEFVEASSEYSPSSTNAALVKSGAPLYISHQELRPSPTESELREGLQALAVLPVKHKGRVIACLNVASHELQEVPAHARPVLEGIAALLGAAIVRLKAEQGLRASEERLRTVAEFTYDWEYWRSPDGRYIYVSPSCRRITGYPAEDFYRNTALMKGIIHPADWKRVGRYCDVAVDSEDPASLEFRILDRNGVEHWIEDVYQSVHSTDGRYLGRRGSIRDITERKRAEHETLEHQRRLQRQQAAIVKLATDEVITTGGFREALRVITETASQAMEVERVSVWLLNEEQTEFRCLDLFTRGAQEHSDGLVFSVRNLSRYLAAIATERAIAVHDVRTDPRTSQYTSGYLDPPGITSILDAAIRVSGEVIGVTCHEHVGDLRTWAPDEVAFAGAIADQVAQAFVNSERKQSEEENARLAAFPRENPNYILVCDRAGHVTYSNPATTRLVAELGLKTLLDLLPENHRELIDDCINSDGRPQVSEVCSGERVLAWSYHHVSSTGAVHLYGHDDTARKRNEMERARLYTAIEQAGESIVITDPEGDIVYVNPAFERVTGYSRAEAIGRNPRILKSSEHGKEFFQDMWNVLKRGETWTGELVNKRKDGSLFTEQTTIAPMRSPAGELVGYVACKMDITARKQAEEENARLEVFPRINPNVILVCDHEGDITYSNPAAIRLMDELGLKTPLELLPDNHRVLIGICIKSDGRSHVSESWFGERVLAWSYHHVPSTGAVHVYGHDDTARQQNETERARLYTAIEQAGESIVITDPAGSIVYVNQAFERLTGYSREAAIGRNPRILKSGEHDDAFYRKMWDTLTGGKSWSGEIVDKCRDGRHIVVRSNIAPMHSASGELLGYVESKMDITEQKRIQEDLQRAKRLETAGQLAGRIAHDFNNLLGPLMAYPELINLMIEPNEKVREMLEDMERAARQIAEINQDLLTLGRRGHYNVDVLNLNTIVENTLRTLALPQNVQAERRLADDLGAVKGGGAQITRILTNLLANAVEAMNNSGVLTVTTENIALEEIGGDYRSIPPGSYVRLDVADTGTGIPADVLDHIFEPFFTTRVTDKKRGSGLGLSVVHAVMEDHEGYIDVRTVPGRGATFSLYFPIAAEEKLQIVEPKAGELAVGQGESVLVIDDDPMQLRIASRLLDQLGYRATTAGSGEEAVAHLTDHPQDVILIDMVMGGIDGTETLRQIKEMYPDQLAVICSGFAANDRVDEAMRMGAKAFLSKPIQIGELAKTIRTALNDRRRTGAPVAS